LTIDKKPLVDEIIVFECTIYLHDFIEGEGSIYVQRSDVFISIQVMCQVHFNIISSNTSS